TSTFSLTVRDAFANATPGYTGVVALSSSDPQALFPQASVNFSAGGTLNNLVAQLRTAGAQSLFARDASAHVAGTGTLSVNAATWGGPNAFKWLQQPTTVQIGDVMSPAPVVQFLDAFGNATAGTSTTYGAPSISTSVLKTAFGSTHQGAYANGVTTFSALTLTPATYTTSTRLTIGTGTVTSDAFDITAPWIPLTDTVNPDKAVTTYGLVSGAGGELFFGGYHSTDRGRTWQLMSLVANAGVCATLPPAAMIASSSTAGVVIGSSEETALGGSGCTAGTYRSTDSGAHWTRIAPTQTSVYATRTQDTQGGEVFLLASLTPISAGHFQPHLVSVSATGSTSTLDSGLPVSDVSYAQAPTLLVADLASTSTVYMTFGDCIANVTGAPCGLYTSANAGTSWTAVDTTGFQLPSNTACTPGFWGIKNLIPHPAGGLVIQTQYYFQCGGPSAGEALVHTTGGWTQLTTSVKLIGLYAFPDASHLYAQVIQNASVTKLSASTDGGATWVAAQTLGLPSVSNLWTFPDAWFAVSVNGSQQILNFERLPIP
ncbi:MAG: hypothetical protein JST92_02365, partial [Deltaproteobacteria bacterium]|nr:hypothetical protein [Deltaproteobacteria bacterium]